MNSVKEVLQNLDRKRIAESWVEMANILKEFPRDLKHVPGNRIAEVLNILLHHKNGLVAFGMNLVDMAYLEDNLKKLVVEIFRLLTLLIAQYPKDYEKHADQTLELLHLTLDIRMVFTIKAAAAKTFITFLENFRSMNLDYENIVQKWAHKIQKYLIQDRRLLLEVISTILMYYPEKQIYQALSMKILRHVIYDFISVVMYQFASVLLCAYRTDMWWTKQRTITLHENQMQIPYMNANRCFYLTCMKKSINDQNLQRQSGASRAKPSVYYIGILKNMLRHFASRDEAIHAPGISNSIYRIVKEMAQSEEIRENSESMKEALSLFSEFLQFFDAHVYEEYELWHGILKSLIRKDFPSDSSLVALRTYYGLLGKRLRGSLSENDKKVFDKVRNWLNNDISNDEITATELRLTVYGFSRIIVPHSTQPELETIFQLIAKRSVPVCSSLNTESLGDDCKRLEEVADYQEALSTIIRYLDSGTTCQMRTLTALCSLMMKKFSELSPTEQKYTGRSLGHTIVNIGSAKGIIFQDFIADIVYEGIVWSCSHTLLIDADIEDSSSANKNIQAITFADYLDLWRILLNAESYPNEDVEIPMILLCIVEELATTCTKLIDSLNLNTKRSSEIEAFEAFEAENETDFRIFLNLVDLFVEILSMIPCDLWPEGILEKLIGDFMRKSYEHPLISGFYKLIEVSLRSVDFSCTEFTTLSSLVVEYIRWSIKKLAEYPQELQISCLRLVLNIPEALISRIIDSRVTIAFGISLKIGLTDNADIGKMALDALERWHKCLGPDRSFWRTFMLEVLPFLQNYLRSEKMDYEKENTEKTSVAPFQKRILLFLGSLSEEITSDHIFQESAHTGAIWKRSDNIEYPMPILHGFLGIKIDRMLPRIIELAANSADRSTRIAACELLYSIAVFIIGKTVRFLAHEDDPFGGLYELLCPTLLRLACDADDLVMQLYNPFMMQITRWLGSRVMIHSAPTKHLVDALFEGFADETNSSVRQISGVYLAEFVYRTMTVQTAGDWQEARSRNIEPIVRRIIDLAVDPSRIKRIAASIAFANLYPIFRESADFVSDHWLRFLDAFVKSLDGCEDPRIHDSLDLIEKVLVEKSALFSVLLEDRSTRDRVKPRGFQGGRSLDIAQWLLQRCGTLDRNCRRKCMKMFETISATVDDKENSVKKLVQSFIKTQSTAAMNDILRDHSADQLLKRLDLCIWFLRNKSMEISDLLDPDNPGGKNAIFDQIGNFIDESLSIDVYEDSIVGNNVEEKSSLRFDRCEATTCLFDFIALILDLVNEDTNKGDHNEEDKKEPIVSLLVNEKLFSLIYECATRPEKIGFYSTDFRSSKRMILNLETLLKKLMEMKYESMKNAMIDFFAIATSKITEKMFRYDVIPIRLSCLRGAVLFAKCKLLTTLKNSEDVMSDPQVNIASIFNTLRTSESEGGSQDMAFCVKSEMKQYLEGVMEYFLHPEYDHDTMRYLIELLKDSTLLCQTNSSIVTHGQFFFTTFKKPIIQAFLMDVESTWTLLEESLNEDQEKTLKIIEFLMETLQREENDYQPIAIEKLARLAMEKFSVLQESLNGSVEQRNSFFNIYSRVVRLGGGIRLLPEYNSIYRWIMNDLIHSTDFQAKIRRLQDFLVCLTDEHSTENPELLAILYNLRTYRKIIEKSEDGKTEVAKSASAESLECFENLLKFLLKTKSAIVLDATMNFALGAAEILCGESFKTYFSNYFCVLEPCNALKSLEIVYKRAMKVGEPIDERMDALRHFLLVSFAHVSSSVAENFFANNIRSIYRKIEEQPKSLDFSEREKLFVSKIISYSLIETMYGKIPVDRINSNASLKGVNASCPEEKLSRTIFRSILTDRRLRAVEGEDKKILRLVHCSAFNCTITIVSLASEEKFYTAVFGENRQRDQLVWEKILDLERKYVLRQTFEVIPKERETTVNIRPKNESRRQEVYAGVKSYEIGSSSLSISAYDLNAVRPIYGLRDEELMSLSLEIDDINAHECMESVCALLITILDQKEAQGLNTDAAENVPVLPDWMSLFCSAMWSAHENIRLFLLKVVVNVQSRLKRYGKFFLEPVLNAINLCLTDRPLNYVVTDALMMLIDWKEIRPTSERGKKLARHVLDQLVGRATQAPTKRIVTYNLGIVESLVEHWRDSWENPANLLANFVLRKDPATMRLVVAFLKQNIGGQEIAARNEIWAVVAEAMCDWKTDEDSVIRTYEAAGHILRHSVGMETYEARKQQIVDSVKDILYEIQTSSPSRLVKCVHVLSQACDDLVEDLFGFVSAMMNRIESYHVAKCIDIFSIFAPKLSPENLIKELKHARIDSCLENGVFSCELACLRAIDGLVGILEPVRLMRLVHLAARYTNHTDSERRAVAYGIFFKIYRTYSGVQSDDVEEIMTLTRKILLSSLLDREDSAIEDLPLDRHETTGDQKDSGHRSLLEVFEKASDAEKNYLQIVALMIIRRARKSSKSGETMFEPLHNCTYREQEITMESSRRGINGSRIPLFAPSILSRRTMDPRSFAISNSSLTGNRSYSQGHRYLRSIGTGPPAGRSLSTNYNRSQRFLADSARVTERPRRIRETSATTKDTGKSSDRQNVIRLHRKYRIGEYPDIEIDHSTILDPLQELVKRDSVTCKNFVVSVLNTLGRIGQGEHCDDMSRILTKVMSAKRERVLADAIFEVTMRIEKIDCPWETMTRVAKTNHLHAQGALFTEKCLIAEKKSSKISTPAAKRPRLENDRNQEDHWTALADFYECIDDIDLLPGIFKSYEKFCHELHLASTARAVSQWEDARCHYEDALQSEMTSMTRDHCFRGSFECLSRLSDWRELESVTSQVVPVEHLLDGNLETEWIVHWAFVAHTQRIFEDRGNVQFIRFLEDSLRKGSLAMEYKRLEEFYAEETAVTLMSKEPRVSRDLMDVSWERVRKNWLETSCLAVQARLSAISRLRGIHHVDSCLRVVLDNVDLVAASRVLTAAWGRNLPSARGDLRGSDVHTAYRCYFLEHLKSKLSGETGNQRRTEALEEIHELINRQTLKMVECALEQKNLRVARKYLIRLEGRLESEERDTECLEFTVNAVKYKLGKAERSKDSTVTLREYSASWKMSHEALEHNVPNLSCQVALRRLISEMSTTFARLARTNVPFFEELCKRANLAENIFSERIDFDDPSVTLEQYALRRLSECCSLAVGPRDVRSECYFHLAKYCHELLTQDPSEHLQLSGEFIRSTLRGMKYGSDRAAYYFPCLLQENILMDEESAQIFIGESAGVDTWRFLSYQSQLVSHLGTRLARFVRPIVEKMSLEYPNAIVYSLRLALDNKIPVNRLGESATGLIENFFAQRPHYDRFIRSLEFVVQPELYLKYHLEVMIKSLTENREGAIKEFMDKLYPENDSSSIVKGRMHRDVVEQYRSELRAILIEDKEIEGQSERAIEKIISEINVVIAKLDNSLAKRPANTELRHYSPWLDEYPGAGRDGDEIEIPGQYTGKSKPVPRQHIRISKINGSVREMRSARRPIRITMLASNGRTYRFLVKFGEDLRLDQRIQQIFGIMNESLKFDVACGQRRLRIDTYQVFPVSVCLGLIEWVDGVRTVEEYVNCCGEKNEMETRDRLELRYEDWIRAAAPDSDRLSIQYKKSLCKYRSKDVYALMNEFTSQLPWDLLRRTFMQLCPSVETFVSMRQNFVTSYATMCLAQWILGVGDRHLGNTLIGIESGRSLGIDFASAFGGGIDQSVPEIAPFRLTPQILGLMKPLDGFASIGATMIHVLTAFRNNRGPLIATIGAVAHEPLNWEEKLTKLIRASEDNVDLVEWLPANKLNVIKKKLNGGNPGSIMLDELAERHLDEDFYPRYVSIITGRDSNPPCERSRLPKEDLSPKEQVQCLIEQATDFNVLGRLFVGWQPWI